MKKIEKFSYFIIGQGCYFLILIVNSSEVCAVNVWLTRMVTEHKDKIIKIEFILCTF